MSILNSKSKKQVKVVALKDNNSLEGIRGPITDIDTKKICCTNQDLEQYTSKIESLNQTEEILSFLKLIANPIRLKILLILLNKNYACNCEFESVFDEHQTLISHHLSDLLEGGLIEYSKKGKWKFYKIKDDVKPYIEKVIDLIHILPQKKD